MLARVLNFGFRFRTSNSVKVETSLSFLSLKSLSPIHFVKIQLPDFFMQRISHKNVETFTK